MKYAATAVLTILLGALAGGLFGRLPSERAASTGDMSGLVGDYAEALQLIDESYGGNANREKMADVSMQTMLWSLDPHSAFFTREEFRKLDEEQSSQFYGIGVSIFQHRDGVYVQAVIPNTPAAEAGLKYGDRILKVDGKDALEWTSSEVSRNVRGERGTRVRIEIERLTSPEPIEMEIVRGGVPLPSVRNFFMLPNGVGYVGLTGGFQQTTSQEVGMAIDELKKRGMKSLILDLRGNPGGILEQAVSVVSKFIPDGKTAVTVRGAAATPLRELKTSGSSQVDVPLVVMINGGSASASEIVAGAVQDYNRGLVVGSESFGKGLVQRIFRLPYGTGLTLTTARYYTPFGRSLQRDYSSGSIYDYYTHGEDLPSENGTVAEPKPIGSPVTLPDGRTLLGGRGIVPDVPVPQATPNPLRSRINEAAFHFVRQLVAGRIQGFDTFRIEKQTFKASLQPNEFAVSDKLFDAFRSYAVNDAKNGLTAANINALDDHAKMRIRQEIATASYSTEAGTQVLLENDPQILKAMEMMPRAVELAAKAKQNNLN
ncbi:MAG: S41 family peptidase [Acidobacteria bacterium]|nr:S41 family peptidase [Acidobacteriota bacterium]